MNRLHSLVVIRHGESEWNKDNRFTGWIDVDLSEKGREEARQAGRLLRQGNFKFDLAYASILKRSIRTLWLTLEELDAMWVPVQTSWRLNERHYGALQGLNKTETALKYGDDQVKRWRRGYDILPPPLSDVEFEKQAILPFLQSVHRAEIPRCESLKSTLDRLVPLWKSTLAPAIRSGVRLLVVAHGNSLRALMQYLEPMPPEELMELNIPTGTPLVYQLAEVGGLDAEGGGLKVVNKSYLGDAEAIAIRQRAVAEQGRACKPPET